MQDDPLQYLSDYVAIRQLNATYNRYADLADGKSYSNFFTEDAEFNIVGEGIYVGREQMTLPNQNLILTATLLSSVFACLPFFRTGKEPAMNSLPPAGISMN